MATPSHTWGNRANRETSQSISAKRPPTVYFTPHSARIPPLLDGGSGQDTIRADRGSDA